MKGKTGHALWSCLIAILISCFLVSETCYALVYYDKGREVIDGVVLLQDISNPKIYYYLPDYPRLSKNPKGDFELMFMKYIDTGGKLKGAIFHALFEFDLPHEKVAKLERKLQWQHPGARLVGSIPLIALNNGSVPQNESMNIVSSVLSLGVKDDAAPKIIASGSAPLHAGARAAVAIRLDPDSASLMWEMLSVKAPDFSVSINVAYEALVTGYRARVTAERDVVGRQIAKLKEISFNRLQLESLSRRLVDQGIISVEIMDSGQGNGHRNAIFDSLISVITKTLTESFFVYTGKDTYALNNIQVNEERHFRLLIDKDVTIRVPIHTTGNLGDLSKLKKDPRYFPQVFLGNEDLYHKLLFLLDHQTVEMFKDLFNSVSVRVRIHNNDDSEKNIVFSREDITSGIKNKVLGFPKSSDIDEGSPIFEYREMWSLIGGAMLRVPAGSDRWLALEDNLLVLLPPFDKSSVSIEPLLDRFEAADIYLATIEWNYRFGGAVKTGQPIHVRTHKDNDGRKLTVYHDRGTSIRYRVIWHTPKSQIRETKFKPLRGELLILDPPKDLPPT